MKIILSYVTHTLLDIRQFSKPYYSQVLDGLAYDLLIGVQATQMIDVLEAGAVTCDGFGDPTGTTITPAQAAACANGTLPLAITDVVLTYCNHSLKWISPSPPADIVEDLPATLAESIPNYLRAESALILMDIGISNNNSILVSPAILNATITPNATITQVMYQNTSLYGPYIRPPSFASIIQTDPSEFGIPVKGCCPSVIAMSYVCHDQRRKRIFSMIICKPFVCRGTVTR